MTDYPRLTSNKQPKLDLAKGWVELGMQTNTDDAAIDAFAERMKAKMAAGRAKGRRGWNIPGEVSQGALRKALLEHIDKGDALDVAIFAFMMAFHNFSTAEVKQ